jgi:hypothetical protein
LTLSFAGTSSVEAVASKTLPLINPALSGLISACYTSPDYDMIPEITRGIKLPREPLISNDLLRIMGPKTVLLRNSLNK